jgi:simple sugar transport system ATP-binding protein
MEATRPAIGAEGTAVLRLRGVTKYFGGISALDGIDFEVQRGEIVGLIGDNGAGKSTLVKIIMGVHKPDAGEMYFNGEKVLFHSPIDARKAGIEVVYQDLALIDLMSTYRNFYLGREPKRWRGPLRLLDFPKMKEVTERSLAAVGIRLPDLDQPVSVLSGGERQSLAISRAFFFGAHLMLLDEPVAALSAKETNKVMGSIRTVADQGGSVVIIAHNIYQIHPIVDRFYVLSRGRELGQFKRGEVTPEEIIEILVGDHNCEEI